MKRLKVLLAGMEVLAEGTYKGIKGALHGHYRSAKETLQEKTLVFLANGPSFNRIRWDVFQSPQTEYACVNFYPLKDERFWTLRPSYLCLIDPVFWDSDAETLVKDNIRNLVESLGKVDWPLSIVTCNEGTLNLKNPNISYVRFTPYTLARRELPHFRHWLYRHNLTSCGAQNVAIGSLYYFVNAGYKTIYLVGIDMSEFVGFSVDENNDIFSSSKHFYANQKANVLEDGLVKKGEFCDLLQLYCKMFAEFRILAEYAVSRNVSVINLNPYSFVDVFPKDVTFYIEENT